MVFCTLQCFQTHSYTVLITIILWNIQQNIDNTVVAYYQISYNVIKQTCLKTKNVLNTLILILHICANIFQTQIGLLI